MASSIDPGIHSKCAAPSWLLGAVSIAKPVAALDVGPSAPAVLRVPQSPSSGSLYLELPRKLEPLPFAKDPSELLQQLADEDFLEPRPTVSEHLAFPCPTH